AATAAGAAPVDVDQISLGDDAAKPPLQWPVLVVDLRAGRQGLPVRNLWQTVHPKRLALGLARSWNHRSHTSPSCLQAISRPTFGRCTPRRNPSPVPSVASVSRRKATCRPM